MDASAEQHATMIVNSMKQVLGESGYDEGYEGYMVQVAEDEDEVRVTASFSTKRKHAETPSTSETSSTGSPHNAHKVARTDDGSHDR